MSASDLVSAIHLQLAVLWPLFQVELERAGVKSRVTLYACNIKSEPENQDLSGLG